MDRDSVINDKVIEENYKVFALLSNYLNNAPDFIKKKEIDEIVKSGVSYEYAFVVILAAAFGLDIIDNVEDKDLFNNYFKKMIHQLEANEYYDDPYYKNIKIPTIKMGNSEIKYEKYKHFEGFCKIQIILKTYVLLEGILKGIGKYYIQGIANFIDLYLW